MKLCIELLSALSIWHLHMQGCLEGHRTAHLANGLHMAGQGLGRGVPVAVPAVHQLPSPPSPTYSLRRHPSLLQHICLYTLDGDACACMPGPAKAS